MKRIAFPVLGAVICLQILAGCKETGQSNNVRIAGKSATANADILAGRLKSESLIKETPLKLEDLPAYQNTVSAILKNLKDQDSTTLGIEAALKNHKWSTLSLFRKNPSGDVLGSLHMDGGYLSFQTADLIQIDKTGFDSLTEDRQAELILNQAVMTLRLLSKGILKIDNLSGQVVDASVSTAIDDQGTSTGSTSTATTADSSEAPTATDVINATQGAGMDQSEVNEFVKASDAAKAAAKVVRLDSDDYKHISDASLYLMNQGRSAKVEEIKKHLQDLGIIK